MAGLPFASAWPADADRIATLFRRIVRFAPFGLGSRKKRALRIAYRIYEPNNRTARATVVLVHGASETGVCWEPFFAPYLAGILRLRVLVVDLFGHGDSEGSARTAHISDYVQSVRAVVLHFGVPDDELVLVGHSMGGITVQRYAELWPVAALCCYCTTLPEKFMGLMMHLSAILRGMPRRPDVNGGKRRRFKPGYATDVETFFRENADVLGGTKATPLQLQEIVEAQVGESHRLTWTFLRFMARPRKPRTIKTEHLLWIAGIGNVNANGEDDGTGDRAYPLATLEGARAYQRRQPDLKITTVGLIGPHLLMLIPGQGRIDSAEHLYALAEQAVGRLTPSAAFTPTDDVLHAARVSSTISPLGEIVSS